MALLNILQYPDERLHTVAKPVEKVDERIQKLVADMFETMYELDHLMGIVFVERLSQLKQGRIKTKLKKRQKHTI